MKPFADEKAAQVDTARDEATSPEPFLLAQAAPGGAPPRPPPVATADEPPPSGALATPSAATKKRWDELVRRVKVTKPGTRAEADQVIASILGTRSGASLVDDLHRVLSKKDRLVSHVVIDFRDKTTIPQEEEEVEGQQEGEAGLFSPRRRYAPLYTVYVGWDDYPGADNDMGSHVSGIFTSLVSGRSMMVETLFHELAHVWFIHAFTDPRRYGDDALPATGHTTFNGPAGVYDFIDPRFRNRLKAMITELEPVERAQRKKNKAAR